MAGNLTEIRTGYIPNGMKLNHQQLVSCTIQVSTVPAKWSNFHTLATYTLFSNLYIRRTYPQKLTVPKASKVVQASKKFIIEWCVPMSSGSELHNSIRKFLQIDTFKTALWGYHRLSFFPPTPYARHEHWYFVTNGKVAHVLNQVQYHDDVSYA
jgi:hypothetical protein